MVDYTKSMRENVGPEKDIATDAYGRVAMSSIMVFDDSDKRDMVVDFNTDVRVEWGDAVTSVAEPLPSGGSGSGGRNNNRNSNRT